MTESNSLYQAEPKRQHASGLLPIFFRHRLPIPYYPNLFLASLIGLFCDLKSPSLRSSQLGAASDSLSTRRRRADSESTDKFEYLDVHSSSFVALTKLSDTEIENFERQRRLLVTLLEYWNKQKKCLEKLRVDVYVDSDVKTEEDEWKMEEVECKLMYAEEMIEKIEEALGMDEDDDFEDDFEDDSYSGEESNDEDWVSERGSEA